MASRASSRHELYSQVIVEMDMSMDDPLMRKYNQKLANNYWFIIVGLIGRRSF
jgi:hypothetical protein